MRRGTTPAIVLTVDADLTGYTVYVTLKNGGKELTILNSGLTITVDQGESTIAFSLTQQQTLDFKVGTCEVQVRAIKDGTAIATDIQTLEVGRILKEGVIDE